MKYEPLGKAFRVKEKSCYWSSRRYKVPTEYDFRRTIMQISIHTTLWVEVPVEYGALLEIERYKFRKMT